MVRAEGLRSTDGRTWLLIGFGALAYLVAARAESLWTFEGHGETAFWPAAGIAAGLAARLPPRRRIVALALVIVVGGGTELALFRDEGLRNAAVELGAVFVEGVIAVVVGSALIRRTPLVGATTNLAWTGIVAVAAVTGAGVAALGMGGVERLEVFGHWTFGHGVALLLVAPLMRVDRTVIVSQGRRFARLELGVGIAATLTMAVLAFTVAPVLTSVVLPMLVWIAARSGPRGGLPTAVATVVIACAATSEGEGPFVQLEGDVLYQLQIILAAIGVTVVLVNGMAVNRSITQMRQRAILGTLPDTAVLVDPDGLIVWQAGADLGRELVGERFDRLVDADALGSGQTRVLDTLVPGRVFECRAQRTSDQMLLAVFRDVTASVEAEAALQESDRRWRRLVESASEGVLEVDPSTAITYASPRFGDMVGVDPEHLVGIRLSDVTDHEVWNRGTAHRLRAYQGQGGALEVPFQRATGEQLYTIASYTPHFDASGSYTGSTIFLTDITALRQAEAERSRLLDELASVEMAEHRRIAQEIHDGPVQDLSAANFMIGKVRIDAAEDPRLARIESTLTSAMNALRDTISALDPLAAERGGLAPALRTYCDRVLGPRGISYCVQESGPLVEGEIGATAYLIAREAISNAARHAGAERVVIDITGGTEAILRVSDDGRGFDVNTPATVGRLGLRSMQQRAADVGATVDLTSGDEGTSLAVRFPHRQLVT